MKKRRELILIIVLFQLALLVPVLATILNRDPTACADSDPSCTVSNIDSSNDVYESTNLQLNPGWINATDWDVDPPAGATIDNVTFHWEYHTSNVPAGTMLINFSFLNGSSWVDCAINYAENITDVDRYCTNYTDVNISMTDLINTELRIIGNDLDGKAAAWVYTDIINMTINYTIPEVAEFAVLMPSDYTCPGTYCYNITATTEAEANSTNWISFNFSTVPETDAQPCTAGDFTNNQTGEGTPIFLIDNNGNREINLSLLFNESLPTGITVSANASCTGTCGGTVTTKTALTTSYQTFVWNLSNSSGSYANITLWGDLTMETPGGAEYNRYLLINSSWGWE